MIDQRYITFLILTKTKSYTKTAKKTVYHTTSSDTAS